MMGAWPPICTSVLPLFHDPTLKRWRLTSQHMFFSLVVQVVCDSFPGPWPLYQNHICPSASSELVIEFLGHDIYQDLDSSLVLRLFSTTQPRNIPHTIKTFYILRFFSELDLQEKECPVPPGLREAHFQVKMYKPHQRRTTFGSCDIEKVHAVVARSTFPSQSVKNLGFEPFLTFRCGKSGHWLP